MASLKLTVAELSEDSEQQAVDQRAFLVLRDYLQPDSETALSAASASILNMLPEEDPKELSILSLSELCIELAEQIPYSHPSQMKLVRLLQQVAQSPKAVTSNIPLRRLGECLRDNLQTPDVENPAAWVNFHSFVAKVEFLVWSVRVKPTWAIWAMRDAFEEDEKHYPSDAVRDAYILGAAQYILFKGQDLVQRIACPGIVSDEDERHWTPGPRYSGPASLDLARWCFWKDGFQAAAARKASSAEIKSVVGKTVALMDALQEAMPGLESLCPIHNNETLVLTETSTGTTTLTTTDATADVTAVATATAAPTHFYLRVADGTYQGQYFAPLVYSETSATKYRATLQLTTSKANAIIVKLEGTTLYMVDSTHEAVSFMGYSKSPGNGYLVMMMNPLGASTYSNQNYANLICSIAGTALSCGEAQDSTYNTFIRSTNTGIYLDSLADIEYANAHSPGRFTILNLEVVAI